MEKRSTSSGLFVDKNKILLAKRMNNDEKYPSRWSIPSGGIEVGETPEEAMVREMKEEIGVTPTKYSLALIFRHEDGGAHYHYFYSIEKWEGDVKNKSENEEIGWFTMDEAEKMDMVRSEEFLPRIKEFMKGRRKS